MSETIKDYELVGSQPSYYSAKVRACLQYKRLPYREIGSNIETISQRVIPETGDHLFPVIFCPDGEVLKDGCDIVEALEKRHPERSILPEDPTLATVATLIETLADEYFAGAMIYYRWVPEDTRIWALDMFASLGAKGVKDAGLRELADGMTEGMAAGIQARLPKIGLDREEIQQESIKITHTFCDLLEKHLKDVPFLLGDRPSLADLGMMNAMWGHLYMDPCEASMYMRRHCTHLSQWLTNMHSAAGISGEGELYLADTMKEALAFLGEAYGHSAKALLNAADARIPDMAMNEQVKPGLGKVDTFLLTQELTRPVSTYGAWRLQRIIDRYKAIPESQKSEADTLLEDIGFLGVCNHAPSWRLGKQQFQLYRTK